MGLGMSRRRRMVVAIALVGVVLLIFAGFFGIQTLMKLETHITLRNTPFVFKRPLPITDTQESEAQGTRLSYFGFSFEVPWEVDPSRSKAVGNFQLVAFTNGNAMLVANPPAGELSRTISGSAEGQRQNLSDLFGEDVSRSDFLMFQTIYNATPSDVRVFASRKHDASRMVLLLLKAFLPPDNDTSVFTIHNATFQGFQLGDPASRPRRILLQLFSSDGELEITLIQKTDGSQPVISQADLNRIIRTVRKSESPPAASDVRGMSPSQTNVAPAVDDCGLAASPVSRSTHDMLADLRKEDPWPDSSNMVAKVEIDPEGKITHLRVLHLAYPKAPADLRTRINTQAVESLKGWHFKPAVFSGKPVTVCSDVSVTIDLN